MGSEPPRKLRQQEEDIMADAATTTSGRYSLNLSLVDLQQTPAPPYTPAPPSSHSLFPSSTTTTTSSQAQRGINPHATRLQIPQSPVRAHTNGSRQSHSENYSSSSSSTSSTPAAPMSRQHSMRSFETAPDLEKGSRKLKLTRSATYRDYYTYACSQLKPFFSRSSEPVDGPAAALDGGVSPRKPMVIAATVLAVVAVLLMGLLFGLMKWFK